MAPKSKSTLKKKTSNKIGITKDRQKRIAARNAASTIGERELFYEKEKRELTPKELKEYNKNVDAQPDAPFGRWSNGKAKGDAQKRMDYVGVRRLMGDATDETVFPPRVVTDRRHILEDDPTLKKKMEKRAKDPYKKASGGSVKNYAYGGRVAAMSAEKS